MQCIPRELWPSSLLWLGERCHFVAKIDREFREPGYHPILTNLEAWHMRADDLLAQGEDNSCALILLYLADQYRELDLPGKALECAQQAERYLNQWKGPEQRHNHAIVHYSLALTFQDMGSEMDAQRHFNEALKNLCATKDRWALKDDAAWQRRCGEAMRWIEEGRWRLSPAPPADPTSKPQIAVPVVGRIAAGEPMLADERFEEWIQVDPDKARRVNLALRVRGDSMIDAGIPPGALVLLEQNTSRPPDKTVVAIFVQRADTEATLKTFYQESDHIRLEPANVAEPFRILKDESVPEEPIRALYQSRTPGRVIEFYPVAEAQIVGWVRGVLLR